MRNEAETATAHIVIALPSLNLIVLLSLCLPPPSWVVLLFGSHAIEQRNFCSFQTLPCSFPLLISPLILTQWQGPGQQSYAAAYHDKNIQTHTPSPCQGVAESETASTLSYLSFSTTAHGGNFHVAGCNSLFITPRKTQGLSKVSMAIWVIPIEHERA